MKRNNILFVSLLMSISLFTIESCKKEDSTTNTVNQAFTQPVIVAPELNADGTFIFSGSTVELKWNSENSSGDPVKWDVFFGTGKSPALFQSGVTTNSISVPVIDGQTYYWKVQISDAHGVITASTVNSFTAVDGKNPKITVDLSCTTDILAAVGLDLKPDEVVDLRLRVINKSDMKVVTTVNAGKSTESYSGLGALADGEYLFAVDIYSTINAGDFNVPVNLDLAIKFTQKGIINQTLEFPKVMTNQFACSSYRVYLAKVVKTGATYKIEKSVNYPSSVYSGFWSGVEMDFYPDKITSTPYESQVKLFQGCTLMIQNLGLGWMNDFWGEDVKAGGSAEITINPVAGTINIPDQYYMTTIYKGQTQPVYNIVGSGTIDLTGQHPSMTISYDLVQNGTSLAGYCKDNGYLKNSTFEAKISLSPIAAKALRTKSSFKFNIPAKK